jgi:nicotinamidase-related amidase
MDTNRTALILIGFQNDYFHKAGVLAKALEPKGTTQAVLRNTLDLLDRCRSTNLTIVSTPIIFTPTYEELVEPIGILKAIKDVEAFKRGSPGAETVPEIKAFGSRIPEIPGRRGLNAFSNTDLHAFLAQEGCSDVVLAGVVTSLCIDSTGRAALERGYRVTILSDCTAGRTEFEQKFYCENIFPLYAQVKTRKELIESIGFAESYAHTR